MRAPPPIFSGALVITLLVGCGAEGGTADDLPSPEAGASSPASSPSFDRARFVTAAEGICEDFLAEVPKPQGSYKDYGELKRDLDRTIAAFTKARDQLAGLMYPPGSEGKDLRRVLVGKPSESLAEVRSAARQLDSAVRTKNAEQYYEAADRLLALADTDGDPTGVLKRAGLAKCDEALG